MHRVRTGLTGLAAIFLMVLIAAAGLRPGAGSAQRNTGGETLAMLGVAPGSEAARKTAAPSAPAAAVAKRPKTS